MLVRTLVEKRHADAVRTIESDRHLADAAAAVCREGIAPLIVTRDGLPVGVLARGDILACLLEDPAREASSIPVSDAMNPELVAVGPDDMIDDALGMMMASDLRSVPILEDSRIVGILPAKDLFQYRLETLSSELKYLQDYITDLQEAYLD